MFLTPEELSDLTGLGAPMNNEFDGLAPIDWIKKNWPRFRFSKHEIIAKSDPYDPRDSILTECGIYFLIYGDRIVYVGQSGYIDARLLKHFKDGKRFNRVFLLEIHPMFLNIVESQYINTLMPELNEKIPVWRERLP